MKKYLMSLAFLVLVSISAKAQFSLGVKGGVNFSKISTDTLRSSAVGGYQAGLYARVGGVVFLEPELYLSSSGGKFTASNNGTEYSSKVTFTNLNVPLLLGARLGGKGLNVHLLAGPVYTYILNKNESFSSNVSGAITDFGNYKNSTLGIQAGGGVDIGGLTVDLRYEGGLSDVNSDFGQRQHLFALTLGFKIL